MSDCQARRAGGPFRVVRDTNGRLYGAALHDSGGGGGDGPGGGEAPGLSLLFERVRARPHRHEPLVRDHRLPRRSELAAPRQPPDGDRDSLSEKGGVPPDVFQALLIHSSAVAGLIGNERVAAVTITGPEPVGRSVAEVAGKNIKNRRRPL